MALFPNHRFHDLSRFQNPLFQHIRIFIFGGPDIRVLRPVDFSAFPRTRCSVRHRHPTTLLRHTVFTGINGAPFDVVAIPQKIVDFVEV